MKIVQIVTVTVFILIFLLGTAVYFLPTCVDLHAKLLQYWRQNPIQRKFESFPPHAYEKNKILVVSPFNFIKKLCDKKGYEFMEKSTPSWTEILNIVCRSNAEFIVVITHERILKNLYRIIHRAGDVDVIFFRDGSDIDRNNFILRNSVFTKRKLKSLEQGETAKRSVATSTSALATSGETSALATSGETSALATTQPDFLDQLYTDYIPAFVDHKGDGKKLGEVDTNTAFKLHCKRSPNMPFRLFGITVYPKKLVLDPNFGILDFSDGILPLEEKIEYRRISKFIFQTMETEILPKKQLEVMKLWKDLNPEYSYHFFDGVSSRDFIEKNFSGKVFQAYEKLMPGAYKADLFRYCLLYVYGGVYVDSRCKPLVKLSEFIEKTDRIVVPSDRLPCYLWQGFLCSVAKHPVLLASIHDSVDKILREDYARNSLDVTGPALFGRCLNIYLHRHPEKFFREGLYRNIRIVTHGFDHSYIRYKNRRIVLTKYSNDEQGFLVNTGKEKYGSAWNRKRVYKPD